MITPDAGQGADEVVPGFSEPAGRFPVAGLDLLQRVLAALVPGGELVDAGAEAGGAEPVERSAPVLRRTAYFSGSGLAAGLPVSTVVTSPVTQWVAPRAGAGFSSRHTAAAVVATGPAIGPVPGLPGGVAVGLRCIALRVHRPPDVVGGWRFGSSFLRRSKNSPFDGIQARVPPWWKAMRLAFDRGRAPLMASTRYLIRKDWRSP